MKLTTLTVICCLFTATLFAQTAPTLTVKGTVIDSASNKPMDFVTVALQEVKTKTAVKSTLSNGDGGFTVSAPQGKAYQLVLAFVGYANKIIPLDSTNANISLGRIMYSSTTRQLGEVSVTAVRPVMKQEVDRISYDVLADPDSKAYTALDMMRKVPLLSVDASDAIKLKGSGAYKILVNGKESALIAKNPSDVLKAMPATNILRIEVITTPPAKYDAEGLAGIINIVTKP
ncbi:MAG: carboxypeptidase-like regulatory domain-containing protein, partial [Mucilaginibacter sp.]